MRKLILGASTSASMRAAALEDLASRPGILDRRFWYELLASASPYILRCAHTFVRKNRPPAAVLAALQILKRAGTPNQLLFPVIETLAELRISGATDRLVDLLQDKELQVRHAALRALGMVGNRDVVRRLDEDGSGRLADHETCALRAKAVARIEARAA